MKGHVRRHGNGYAHIIDIGRDPETGKRRQKWTSGFRTKALAETDLRQRLHVLDGGGDAFPVEITVEQWSAVWLKHLETQGKPRPRTREAYAQLVKDHVLPTIGTMPMRRVRPAHLQAVLDALTASGRSPRTVCHCRAAMSAMFAEALRQEVVSVNTVRATTSPAKQPPKLVTPTPEQLRKIIDLAKGSSWEIPILLAASTGARRGEIVGLDWEHVDLERGRIVIVRSLQRVKGEREMVAQAPKTDRGTRSVPLTAETVERLRRHRVEQAEALLARGVRQTGTTPVCAGDVGQPCNPDELTRAGARFATAVGAAGARLHDYRHAVATMLAGSGNPVELTSRMMGHSSTAFTLDVYTHPVDERFDAVGALIGEALG